jgi:hypothetical protein
MDEEHQPKKEGEKPHKNKALIDEYGATINLDEKIQKINYRTLHKGFCPVEIIESEDHKRDLKILPSESFFKYIDRKGNLLKYTQERSMGDVITTWEGDELDKIVWFQFGEGDYGMSLLEPIGELLDARSDMNKDMPAAIHRWAYPYIVWETSGAKAQLQDACENRDIDEHIFIGNAQEGDVRWKPVEVNPQARFIPYIELIYYQIAEGLHAPLLLYLKNATEASATVMMESVDRLVNGVQRYIKRRIEKYLFEPICGDPVPRVMWGQPKTGLEDTTLTDIAAVFPYMAKNQQQHILKQYLGSLPEPEWQEPNIPQIQTPFQQTLNKKPELNTELLIEKLNDLATNLNIIETNYTENKISLLEACRLADRAITVHMKQAYPDEWEKQRDKKYQEFLNTRLIKKAAGKEYKVIAP